MFLANLFESNPKKNSFREVIFAHHELSKCSKTGKKLSKRSISESIFKMRVEKISTPERLMAQCLKSIGVAVEQDQIDLSSACELLIPVSYTHLTLPTKRIV